MKVQIQPYGSCGYLVTAAEFDDLEQRQLIDLALSKDEPFRALEHVWGAHNLLLLMREPRRGIAVAAIEKWFATIDTEASGSAAEAGVHTVPVVYDGADLQSVADTLGLSVGRVIQLHTAPEYGVRMIGFSPGFPYLDGLDTRLQLPRKQSPRTRIDPGAVAIGGPHAGIYSVASPGGWHLLGRTTRDLFRVENARNAAVDAACVFKFKTGERIRFVPVEGDLS